MSDNWNQQSPGNQRPDNNVSPNANVNSDHPSNNYQGMRDPGTQNVSNNNNINANQPDAGLASHKPAQPSIPGLGLPSAGAQPPQSPWQRYKPSFSQEQQEAWSHAKDTVRNWTGKMAAVVNHRAPSAQSPQQPQRPSQVPSSPIPARPAPYAQPPAYTQPPAYAQPPQPFVPVPDAGRYSVGMPPAGLRDLRGMQSSTPMPPRRSRATRIAWQKRQRRNKKSQIGRVIAITCGVLAALIVLSGFAGTAYGYSYYQQELPQMQKYANQQISQTSRIYDRNGVLLYEAYDQSVGNQKGRRVAVKYSDVPQVMQDAMISIEDKTFWTNEGVDVNGLLRAASAAGNNGGGSTITQQLIKNLSNNTARTPQRKLAEAAMAIGLTQNYPKTKILEMYFNIAPFGTNTYGVEVAAEDLFGLMPDCKVGAACVQGISKLEYNQATKKNDPILGLARASLLATIPNNPTFYDPSAGALQKTKALGRQKQVLQDMITQGMSVDNMRITPAMAQQAEALTAKMTFKPYGGIMRAPAFVQEVVGQVETALGHGDAQAGAYAFLTGGYNIRTSIDYNLDDYAQRAIQDHLYKAEVQKGPDSVCPAIVLANDDNGYCDITGKALPSNVKNGAVVVQDVKTGEILAMVGSANYNSGAPQVDGNINMAMQPRQPGSTFKLFDYATAFQMGWSPGITLADTMSSFPTTGGAGSPIPPSEDAAIADAQQTTSSYPGTYRPSDYGATWWNFMDSITWATANSMNVPAVRAMQFAGPQAVEQMAERLGVTFIKSQGFGYSAAIGANAISPLQMVNAYATFGNNGVRVPPQTILDIWNNDGQVLFHYDESHPHGTRVVSPQVAYEMTMVLSNEPARAFEFTGDTDLSLSDVDQNCEQSVDNCGTQMAAKTGTTDNFTDNWTIGYTPNVAVAVWVGNDDNTALKNSIGITGAAPIFHSVMERTLGYCNYSAATQKNPNSSYAASEIDKIPCGAGGNYHFSFSNHLQGKFTQPSGVTQGFAGGGKLAQSSAPTIGNLQSANNPLAGGSGATAVEYDWMLDGE